MTMETEKSLLRGLERLGMMAEQIRKNGGKISPIEADILLQELRDLYVIALDQPKEIDNSAAHRAEEEAAARKKAEEEAAARKKAEEEAAARRKAEEEAAARKKAEEEAAARKKAEEEAAARKKAEEEAVARKKAEEEAAARKQAEEEAAARKKAEEEAKRIENEEKPVFAPEEPVKEEPAIMPPVMESIEGNPNDTLFDTEETKPEPQGNSLFSYLNNPPQEEKPTVRTLADTLQVSQHNVEERLEKKVNAKKVDDLRTIININDKFSFMSELFHNNMKGYNDFILHLNTIADRDEAMAYVNNVAGQYEWDQNSMAVQTFFQIFDRKF